jgi:hypothetical protein
MSLANQHSGGVLRVHRDTHASATLALYTCLCTRMHTALCIGINGILLLFFLLLTLPTVTHRQTGPSRLHAAIISSISVVHIRFHNIQHLYLKDAAAHLRSSSNTAALFTSTSSSHSC